MRQPLSSALTTGELAKYIKIQVLKKAFDLLHDHVIITDENGNILYANQAVKKQTGYDPKEIFGKNPADLWGGHMPKEVYEEMWRTIKEEKKAYVGEVRNVRKDGTEYWQEAHISPVLDKHNTVQFFIGIEPNISEKKEREAFAERFASIAAHQLRDPLLSLSLTLGWLAHSGELSERDRHQLEDAYGKNQALINLVADLLVLARLGSVKLDTERVNIVALIEPIISLVKEQNPDVSVSFEHDDGTYETLANKPLATQVFANLIGNAASYADEKEGEVRVSLSLVENGIRFSCFNNGSSITPEDQKKIFTPLWRGSGAKARRSSGAGLGLAIVKMIADAFEWRVSFKSAEGAGVTFFVDISTISPRT